MGYRDVSDRAAVLAAISECDALGAEQFRQKYGFGASTGYVLVHDGRSYDSKAILGVAHGEQYPDLGPLTARDFSGGEATVVPILEALGFVVAAVDQPKQRRSPNWTRDELILAVDLYLTSGYLDDTHPAVIELSEVLNRLPIHPGWAHGERFRNPNGVTMKLGNIARLDPRYPGKGLDAGSKLDAEVWDRYHDSPDELHRLAQLIRAGAAVGDVFPESPEPDEDAVEEGRLIYRFHRHRERDPELVRRRKAAAVKSGEGLVCEVCGFDYRAIYGPLGEGYIECHHRTPLSQSGLTKTRPDDLALLCANCHRMAHRGHPWKTVEELQGLVAARSRPGTSHDSER